MAAGSAPMSMRSAAASASLGVWGEGRPTIMPLPAALLPSAEALGRGAVSRTLQLWFLPLASSSAAPSGGWEDPWAPAGGRA